MFGEQFSVHDPGQGTHSHRVGNSKGYDTGKGKPRQFVGNGGMSVLEIMVQTIRQSDPSSDIKPACIKKKELSRQNEMKMKNSERIRSLLRPNLSTTKTDIEVPVT